MHSRRVGGHERRGQAVNTASIRSQQRPGHPHCDTLFIDTAGQAAAEGLEQVQAGLSLSRVLTHHKHAKSNIPGCHLCSEMTVVLPRSRGGEPGRWREACSL